MFASLPSNYLTLGFEKQFYHTLYESKCDFEKIWNPPHPSVGVHPVITALGTTLLAVEHELLSAIENALKLPLIVLSTLCLEAPLVALGFTARLLSLNHLSHYFSEARQTIPGVVDLVCTAYKVIGFLLGAALTLTLGMIRTEWNYQLHLMFLLPLKIDPSKACVHHQEILALQAQLQQLETQRKDLETTLSTLKSAKGQSEDNSQRDAYEAQIRELRFKTEQLERDTESLTKQLASYLTANTELLKEKEAKIETPTKPVAEKSEDAAALKAENNALRQSVEAEKKSNTELTQQMANLRLKMESAKINQFARIKRGDTFSLIHRNFLILAQKLQPKLHIENKKIEGLFRVPASEKLMQNLIQESHRKISDFKAYLVNVDDCHLLAKSISRQFNELKQPLLPFDQLNPLFPVNEASDSEKVEVLKKFLQKIPSAQYELLEDLFLFLNSVLPLQPITKMNLANLSMCWNPVIFQPTQQQVPQLPRMQSMTAFMIEKATEIF